MYYSEYLTLIKNEIQLPLIEPSDYPRPVRFICIAITRLADKTPLAYQKKLKAKIRELITKQRLSLGGVRLSSLILDHIQLDPKQHKDVLLAKRIMLLESMIVSARKREAKQCQKTLL